MYNFFIISELSCYQFDSFNQVKINNSNIVLSDYFFMIRDDSYLTLDKTYFLQE